MYIILWPCGLLTFCNSFVIKVGLPENLFSLYLFSLQSPSRNRYILIEQRHCGLQQRKNVLTQGSYVVNSKATACFSCIPTILANALPGAHWVKDKETR